MFPEKADFFVQNANMFRKLNNFEGEFSDSGCSFGHVELSFDRHLDVFLAESQ